MFVYLERIIFRFVYLKGMIFRFVYPERIISRFVYLKGMIFRFVYLKRIRSLLEVKQLWLVGGEQLMDNQLLPVNYRLEYIPTGGVFRN